MATSAGDETEGNAPALEELATDLAVLRARLERAEGVLAIQALKAHYAKLVDRRYRKGAVVPAEELAALADEVARLFTEDGVWDGGPALGRAVGRAAIAERLRDTTLVFARHLFMSPRIEIDDDGGRARGRWELLSPCRTAEGRDIWMCGSEDDEYERVAGTWLHRSMRLTTTFVAPYDEGWTTILT
ncbi:MAG: nuclear transport factor 2 family protein [Acidimicrobiales bacterium]